MWSLVGSVVSIMWYGVWQYQYKTVLVMITYEIFSGVHCVYLAT